MERIIDVAAYICDEYQKQQDALIGETKLHKLLYLSQREMLAIINKPLFVEPLEGWRHGPVSTPSSKSSCNVLFFNRHAAHVFAPCFAMVKSTQRLKIFRMKRNM